MVDWVLTGRDPNFGEDGRWQGIGHHRQQINGGAGIQGFSSSAAEHHTHDVRGVRVGKGGGGTFEV